MDVIQSAMYVDVLGTPLFFWLAFAAIVVTLLAFDLGVLHKSDKEIGARESFALYAGYVAIAGCFGAWVWWARGAEAGLEFYTGYIIEQSLSMDNVFVIAMIFGALAIPRAYQHRVLFWGILGVIVLRAILIGAGVALVQTFSWILFVFGAFLIFTGWRMFVKQDHAPDIENNRLLKWLRGHFPITNQLHGHDFTVRLPDAKTGKMVLHFTPLLVALIMVEFIDLVFAVDSVPAIFAITQDPFIVYTSNIFAILGLRSLYFALAAAMHRFAYLQYALATIVVLVGTKIFLVPLGIKVPILLSLGVTLGILGAGVAYSLWKSRRVAVE
jgi:tellurite resistance protein TerC